MNIGLGLIVKNEEKDIARCLNSFIPQVDRVCIIDTGSSDATLDIAENILHESGIEYDVFPYHDANDSQGRLTDFSRARNQYIKELEGYLNTEYIMQADADDELITPNIKEIMQSNESDFYSIIYRMNPSYWFRSFKIWRANIGVKYEGRVHETIKVNWNRIVKEVPIEVQHHWSVNPSMETGTQRNMRILKSEIYPPLRSLFYWANENVDSRNYEEAIKWYKEYIRRAKAGEHHWDIELAHCYFRAARWLQHLGRTDEAISLSKELLDKDPSWSESWCELAYIARINGDMELSNRYLNRAKENRFVPRLFSEQDKYGEEVK